MFFGIAVMLDPCVAPRSDRFMIPMAENCWTQFDDYSDDGPEAGPGAFASETKSGQALSPDPIAGV
jgi:hypothetical protein